MALCTANFGTGVNGHTISTSDGGDAIPFDTVSIAANGSAVYDGTHFHHGRLSGKFSSQTASPSTCYVGWTTALGTMVEHYGRLYVWPNENWQTTGFIRWFDIAVGAAGGLYLTGTNTIQIRDSLNVTQATTPSIGTGAWVRIEWHVIHSLTVGQIEVRLFSGTNVDGFTPDSVTTTAANLNTNDSAAEARYGIQSSDFPITAWIAAIVDGAPFYPRPDLETSGQLLTVGMIGSHRI